MFSVVVPLYNKAHTIINTIASVLKQTFSDFELIIVDDGSTDNGVEQIRQFTSDNRVKIFSQKNQGVSVARNRGVKESKYDYVAFLDGDDEWMPGFLFAVKSAIDKYPTAGLFGTASLHKDLITGKITDSTPHRYQNKTIEVDCFKYPESLPHTSATVVLKHVLYYVDQDYNSFPPGMKVCEDWACFHRVMLSCRSIYIGRPLGIRNNNVLGQVTKLSGEEREKLYPDVILYYNLVFLYWLKLNKRSFLIHFLKYELRHRIKYLIKSNDKFVLNLLIQNLDKRLLSTFEKSLYSNINYKELAVFYINFTKLYSKISKILY